MMEECRKIVFVNFLVLYITTNGIQCKSVGNFTKLEKVAENLQSESRTILDSSGYYPPFPQNVDENEVAMKYYPEQESDFDDYPASYYRDPSKFFAKPGFAAGFGAGFLPGLGALGFLHSLKWKVGAVTIIKIILKVILFKKIIKFIILLFLLIFTPSLFSIFTGGYGYGQGDNGLFRKFNYERSDNEKINDLAMFVLTSIDSYQNAKECRGHDEEYECRLNRMFKMIEAKYPFQKALQNYRKKINAEDQTEASPS